MTDAIVVGAGPNGLAAAVALAEQGVAVTVLEAEATIGGGTRTSENTLPGVLHDDCSAIHPTSLASPFLNRLGLERHGLRWLWPEVDLAHPLDSGAAGVLVRSLERTTAGLGADGPAWNRLVGPLAAGWDELIGEIFRPLVHLPRHPLLLAQFGLRAPWSATALARTLRTAEARALFGGCAAHSFAPLTQPLTAALGLIIAASSHGSGWPVAEGGSRAITDALAARLTELGGTVKTGVPVESYGEVSQADVVMLDLAPRVAADLMGDALPPRVAKAYRRYRPAPGAFKLDLAVQGGVPWTNESCRRAGTLHLGGTLEEMTAAERDTNRGRMPERPFVLVGQQYLADPSRSAGDVHPIYAYAHVPNGYPGDASEAIIDQIERFAPGTRERIVGRFSRSTAELPLYNRNFLGGDIVGGANDIPQMVLRPRIALDPYATGVDGVYLCSAATPPGAGVHGMCGANAADSALKHLRR